MNPENLTEDLIKNPERAMKEAFVENEVREIEGVITETNKRIAELYPDAFTQVETIENGINRQYWVLKKSVDSSDSNDKLTDTLLTPRGIITMAVSSKEYGLANSLNLLSKTQNVLEKLSNPGFVIESQPPYHVYLNPFDLPDQAIDISVTLENPLDEKIDIETYKKRFSVIQEQRKNDTKVIDEAIERWS